MNNKKAWAVYYHRDLEKEIRRLPRPHVSQILTAIETLAENPQPDGCKKIKGSNLWRIRVGVYRILYSIDEENRTVSTYRIGHRKAVYRNL